jgi:hypothetical protein
MKYIYIIILFITALSSNLFAQIKIDTVYNFTNLHKDSKNTFIRTINIINKALYVSLSINFVDNYVYKSDDNGNSFELLVKDTSVYKWESNGNGDSVKYYGYNDSPFPVNACKIKNDILFYRDEFNKGLISKIDYLNHKFIDDSLFYPALSPTIESKDSIVIVAGASTVLKSTDYGLNWIDMTPDRIKIGYDTTYRIFNSCVRLFNDSVYYLYARLYIPGDIIRKQCVLKTKAYGKSWKIITTILNDDININDIWVSKDGVIFLCGAREIKYINKPSKYYEWISRSFNDGKSWSNLVGDSNRTSLQLNYIEFYDSNFGVAYSTSDLYYTLDGGDTWKFIYCPQYLGISLRKVEFIDNRTILVGEENNGKILKLQFNLTDIVETNNKINDLNVYPNPAKDYIEIISSIGACSNDNWASQIAAESINIFDMLGVIQSTPSLRATPQRGELRIDVSFLAPGMYFIKIGNSIEKFVKM